MNTDKSSRHYKLAKKILYKAKLELLNQGFSIGEDNWPYHISISKFGEHLQFSLVCTGFTPRLDLLKLTKSGGPDRRCKERSYSGTGNLKSLVKFLKEQKWDTNS